MRLGLGGGVGGRVAVNVVGDGLYIAQFSAHDQSLRSCCMRF